ncbi:MAG TPA: PTS sugar transporter subunit IIA [Clostridia bacterium]|nr:PTS sugar transporter subunit IIA [Clostridia bacterium]
MDSRQSGKNASGSFKCLQVGDVRTGLRAADKYQAIRMAGEQLVARGCVDPAYVDAMLERENVVTTYIGEGVPFGDERACLVVGIAGLEQEHLPILQALANIMLDEERIEGIKHSEDPAFIYENLIDGGGEV